MIKERFQEILEFTKSESPYRRANKGWINQDTFFELGESSSTINKNEAAKITFFWRPIQKLISNIFWIIFISSIVVFVSIKSSDQSFRNNILNILSKDNVIFKEEKILNQSNNNDNHVDQNLNSESIKNDSNNEINFSKEITTSLERSAISVDLEENKEDFKIEAKTDKHIPVNQTRKSKSNFF